MPGNISAAIPGSPGAPLVDGDGNVTVAWRAWFQVLERRTGGPAGSSTGDEQAARIAADTALQASLDAEATTRANADTAEASARAAADAGLATSIGGALPRTGGIVSGTLFLSGSPPVALGSGGPTWTAGAGVPASVQPIGSLFSRTDGATGSLIYGSLGAGAWTAIG